MLNIRYVSGWLVWHVRAFFWYVTLAFRLYFAVGLDRDFHPDRDQDMSKQFKYMRERTYLKHLKNQPSS